MDILANVLTHIRNASAVKKPSCLVRHSRITEEVLKLIKREGYISDFKIEEKGIKKNIRVFLSYDTKGEPVIHSIKRISKPGRRIYSPAEKIRSVLGGVGTMIISTNKGMLTGKEAKAESIGGEVVCEIY